jgi:hypothetical protein
VKPRTLIGFATVLALLLGWYLATDLTGLIDRQRFPSPSDIAAAGSQIMSRGYAGGTLLTQALYSLRLVLLGFFVAALTGVPLGLMMGLSRRFEAAPQGIDAECRKRTHAPQQTISSIDYHVGEGEQLVWNIQTERICGPIPRPIERERAPGERARPGRFHRGSR